MIVNRNPNDLEDAFYKAARTIREQYFAGKNSLQILSAAKTTLQVLEVDDATTEVAARSLELERGAALWLMTQLANKMQSQTKELGMADANLEHIFPQNPGREWINKAKLEPFIWHLGNLTILGEKLNRQAQNKDFDAKKASHYSKSEIKMSQELLSIPEWNPATLQRRADRIAKLIVQTWR